MLSLQDILFFILIVFSTVWWKRKPLSDFSAQIPGCDGLPFIGILYKFIGVRFEGL